ncbi:MAG: tandem-95 repeat protein [Flavobacteriales bacterium]|nr:tandem-95 repeat protein [Flavobacteriales bacterium]
MKKEMFQKRFNMRRYLNIYTALFFAFLTNVVYGQVPSSWTVNAADYSNTITVTCKINFNCVDEVDANNYIAAFVGGQCRGIAQTNVNVSSTGDQIAMLTVYSNSAIGEEVSFMAYRDASNASFVGIDTIIFKSDSVYGLISSPFVVTENHTPTDISMSSQSIVESAMIGDTVGLLSAVDDDSPNVFTYALPVGQYDNASYLVNGEAIELNTLLDYTTDQWDTLYVEVTDALGCTYGELIAIEILDSVYQPIANPDVATTNEDIAVIIDLTVNDTDLDNDLDTNSIALIYGPNLGSTTILNGQLTYTPNANENGLDTIVYQICDMSNPSVLCDTAIVLITINPVADVPVADPDVYFTPEDSTITMAVLQNDYDYDNDLDTTSLTVLQGPTNGTYSITTSGEIVYTPNPFYNGADTLVYELCDLTSPTALCDTALVVVNVVGVPNAPVAVNDTTIVDEDLSITVNVLNNDTDADNDIDTASVSIYLGPFNGVATVDILGNVTYQGNFNYSGLDSMYYVVCDESLTGALCDTALIYITVNPVADNPVADPDSYVTLEDTTITMEVLQNDYDYDNDLDTTSLTVLQGPTNGTYSITTVGAIVYTPNPFYNGSDTLVYELCDLTSPTALCDTALVVVNVVGVPNAPVAVNDTTIVDEDLSITVNVLNNDTDADNDIDTASVSIYLGPFNGVATVDILGNVTYQGNFNYSGLDSMYYVVCDESLTGALCDTALIYITVNPVADNPVADPDSYVTLEDTTITMEVLQNDYDYDSDLDTTSLTVLQGPTNGTYSITTSGEIVYTPNPFYNGADTLVYELCDLTSPTALCDTALVVVNVVGVPNAPVAVNDTTIVDEDLSVTVNVLNNDTDADNDIDTASVSLYLGPFNGIATVDTLGNITYQGNFNYNGLDSMYYVVCDESLTGALCDTALIYITVNPVADNPFAEPDSYVTLEDTTITMEVLQNDYDYDNDLDTTSLTVLQGPTNGTYSITTVGAIVYTPNPFYNGSDTLVYELCDLTSPTALCDTALVVVNVVGVPNAPVAVNDTTIVDEDLSITVNVLNNDTDADNDIDTASVSLYLGPFNGVATVDTLGNVTYQGNFNYNGWDSLYYIVCDFTSPTPLCDTAMMLIEVMPIADAPIALNDTVFTDEDTAVSIDVLSNDSDPENDVDVNSLVIVSLPSNGSASISTGQIQYVPDAYFYGLDSLVYAICDLTTPTALCDTAVVYIEVLQVPNAPYDMTVDTLFVYEDNELGEKVGTIQTLDYDPYDEFTYSLISGSGDEDNAQFSISDNVIYIETKTNYDIKQYYNLRVEVMDMYGLTYEEAFVVEVLEVEGVEVPLPSTNFISPNGDGKNDYWKVQNIEIYQEMELLIFDQFGQILYQVDGGYDNSWDGYYNGQPLPTGNYYYVFRNENVTFKGNITIVNN